jgi:hypothetical protein
MRFPTLDYSFTKAPIINSNIASKPKIVFTIDESDNNAGICSMSPNKKFLGVKKSHSREKVN